MYDDTTRHTLISAAMGSIGPECSAVRAHDKRGYEPPDAIAGHKPAMTGVVDGVLVICEAISPTDFESPELVSERIRAFAEHQALGDHIAPLHIFVRRPDRERGRQAVMTAGFEIEERRDSPIQIHTVGFPGDPE